MFATHNPVINDYAQAGAGEFADVARFVLATIQQSIETVPVICQDFRDQGAASRFAFGWKAAAIDWHNANAGRVLSECLPMARAGDVPALIDYCARLPGLGVVKGGFLVQLAFGLGGCLDRHNLALYGVSEARFSASAYAGLRKPESRVARVAEYCAHIERAGGCAVLWDAWCNHVASLRPSMFTGGGFQVSALHVEALAIGGRA